WTPTAATKNEPPGWTSPSGRRYASEHPDWEPPVWPEHRPERWPTLSAETEAGLMADPGPPADVR
ncbi:MAG TPA: endonuclease, partial [Arthrobacter sp.]